MNVALAAHPKELAGNFEIVGVDDAVADLKRSRGFLRDAVAAARNDRRDQPGERPQYGNGEHIAV